MEGTKYNLTITTDGQDGDHASTNISTSNPGQLADILKLAGMSGGGHPVALSAPEAPAHEEHGSCDVCGGMHEDDDHVVEGESWDNEPDEVIHSPEEITQTGNDLHKVKKTYPIVNGGDNPMALEDTENKLRQQFADFLAEDYDEELPEENELKSPWKKTVSEGEMVYVPSKEDVEGNAAIAIAAITDLATEGGGELNVTVSTGGDEFPPTDGEEYHTELGDDEVNDFIENKNMNNMRDLMDHLDSIDSSGSTVVTEATNAEIQAKIAALQKQLAAQTSGGPEGGSDETYGSYTAADYDKDGKFIGTPLQVFGKAEKNQGPEGGSDEQYGSYTDADYDDQGNFIGTPLQVFGKAEKNQGPEGGSDEVYGSLPRTDATPRTDTIRARAEGLQARLAAAREAGYDSLKAARAGGHPSGSEHTWTGSGAFEVDAPIAGADQVSRDSKWAPGDERNPGNLGATGGDPQAVVPGPGMGGDPALQDIVKLSGAPPKPESKPAGGSWSAEQQAAMAKRQQARVAAQAAGGSDETYGSYTAADYDKDGKFIGTPLKVFGKAEKQTGKENNQSGGSYTDADYDKDGKFIGTPLKVFGKAPKQTGKENNQSGGSATYDKDTGKLTSKPLKVFTKAPVPTSGGRDE